MENEWLSFKETEMTPEILDLIDQCKIDLINVKSIINSWKKGEKLDWCIFLKFKKDFNPLDAWKYGYFGNVTIITQVGDKIIMFYGAVIDSHFLGDNPMSVIEALKPYTEFMIY